MKTITRSEMIEKIKNTNGRIFGVTFTRRKAKRMPDGSLSHKREMTCRLGVKSYLKGGHLAYNPDNYGLLIVFDMQAKDYRAVPLDAVEIFNFGGETYKIT